MLPLRLGCRGSGDPEEGGPQRGRRLYGVVEEGRGLRCVLSEVIEPGGLHHFTLCSPEVGILDFAEWACAPALRVDENGRPHPMLRTVEAIQPAPSGPVQTRLLVLVGRDAVALAEIGPDNQPGEPSIATAADLRTRLERALRSTTGAS